MSPVLHSRLERNLLKKARSLGSCAIYLLVFSREYGKTGNALGYIRIKEKRMETI